MDTASVSIINAKGRSIEGRSGISAELREKNLSALSEKGTLEFLSGGLGKIPRDGKILLMESASRVGGKIHAKWISRDDEGYITLDGAIPAGYFVLVEANMRRRRRR